MNANSKHARAWPVAALLAAASIAWAGQPMPPADPPAQSEEQARREADRSAREMETTPQERRAELQALARTADRLAQKRFDEMQRDFDQNWSKLNARSREQARAALEAARREQVQFRAAVRRLDADSSAAWTDIRSGVVAAYRDLAYALSTARQQFRAPADTPAEPATGADEREEEDR